MPEPDLPIGGPRSAVARRACRVRRRGAFAGEAVGYDDRPGSRWLDGYIQRQHEQGDPAKRDGLVSTLGSFLVRVHRPAFSGPGDVGPEVRDGSWCSCVFDPTPCLRTRSPSVGNASGAWRGGLGAELLHHRPGRIRERGMQPVLVEMP